jgi:hypothetical protein
MPASEPFNPVSFSKNINSTISRANAKLPQKPVASANVTLSLNQKTGVLIAVPPVPAINNNVRGLVGQVKGLAANPAGVVSGVVKTQFGAANAAIRAQLNLTKITLLNGVRNCIRRAISSLLSSIPFPNIPFGGLVVDINKKLNKYLNLEIILQADLLNKRLNINLRLTKNLDILKNNKLSNYYTTSLNGEINKELNKICNKLSPRNRKNLSRGGSALEIYSNVAVNGIVNCLEKKIVTASKGFSAKAPTDFLNRSTGRVDASINKTTGGVNIAADKINNQLNNVGSIVGKTITGSTTDINSAVSKTTGKVTGALGTVNSRVTDAYNNVTRAISSNVPKQLTDNKKC